jgi:hypothetical protein
MLKRKWTLMDQVGDGVDGGGTATSAAPDAATVSAPAIAPVAPVIAADATALAAGAQPVVPPVIPEKYQIKKDDGTIDIEASSLKLAEAYGNLEKRLGTGDIPPKTAEEYEVKVPDALKESWNPKEDPLLQSFLKDAHAIGMTQKQLDMVMGKYMELAPELVDAGRQLDAEACTTELKAVWKTDEQYKAEVSKAYKAAVGYFGADADAIIKEYGNDPRIIRGFAKLGGEMGEDKSLNFGSVAEQSSIDSIMTSEAYNKPNHPDHARVSAQVRTHFEKLAKAAEAAGNIAVM